MKKILAAEVVILAILTTLSYRRGGLGIGPLAPRAAFTPWASILDSSRAIDWSNAGVEGGIPTYTTDCGTFPPTGIGAWKPKTTYRAGDRISDTMGNLETVQTAGTSGTTEPSWPWQVGSTSDGTVSWSMSIGGTDSTQITDAIVDCDGKQGIVHLTAGHYYITAGITFNRSARTPRGQFWSGQFTGPISYVLLKGAGPMQTYLHFPRVGCANNADICVQASTNSFSLYPSAAAWLGTGTTLNTYPKGATRLISGPWTGSVPAQGDGIMVDQNSDAFSICPTTPPSPAYNCTIAGATANGNIATIVTSIPTGYHVGDCIGIGGVGGKNNTTAGFNITANPNKSVPGCLPAWQKVTAVGCIVSGGFVDQASCASNPLVALQFDAGRDNAGCPTLNCLASNGDGQVALDTGGVFVSHIPGATAQVNSDPLQNARVCPAPAGAPNPVCLPGEISYRKPVEMKTIKTVTLGGQGDCTAPAGDFCFDLDEPLYLPSWRSSQRPGMFWLGAKNVGDGLEGFTYITENNLGSGSNSGIKFHNARNGWVRNVRALRVNRNFVLASYSSHITIADNYIASAVAGASTSYSIEDNTASDNLVINNICNSITNCAQTQTTTGRVIAYNYASGGVYLGSGAYGMPNLTNLSHLVSLYNLMEGNNSNAMASDNIHGTGGVSTGFRNRLRGQDIPVKGGQLWPTNITAFNRGMNAIGNVLGTAGAQTRYSQSGQASASGTVWNLLSTAVQSGGGGTDPLVTDTLMRWGNYDVVTGVTRWCGSGAEGSPDCGCGGAPVGSPNNPSSICEITAEVPTQGHAFLPAVSIPVNHNLPASFFLAAQPAFWTTAWGTPGWPAIGPDVTATGALNTTCAADVNLPGTGPGTFYQCDGIGNHAYQIPAQMCFANMPVDPQFQVTLATVRGGRWANIAGIGNFITLDVNNTINLTSPFTVTVQVTGITPATYNGVYLLYQATPTTITYWKSTDPGLYQLGGMVTTPNIKQFDARQCYPNEPL